MKRNHPAPAVRYAERVVRRAYRRARLRRATGMSAGALGLARAPACPGSDAIQLVTRGGTPLGYVRREGPGWGTGWWAAVSVRHEGECGRFHSAAQAAAVLARLEPGARP